MIKMRVRRENVRHTLPVHRPLQRLEVRLDHRAGIDHGDARALVRPADDIDTCAEISERPRVLGDDAADQRAGLRRLAILELKLAHERDASHGVASNYGETLGFPPSMRKARWGRWIARKAQDGGGSRRTSGGQTLCLSC